MWTFEKPLVLKGGTGRTIWSDVMFATKTATLRWTGTPAGRTGCTLTVMLESKRLPKTIRMTSKSTTTKPLAGSTSIAINYGDGTMTVTSDCARWTVTVRPTGHPGVAVKRATEQTATNATTPAGLNVALGRSHVDWWISTSYTYAGTVSPRLLSKEVTLDVTFELPKWTAPKGADARLVEAWSSALAGMKRHTEGEAVIAVQAAGRYLAALTKTRFPSMSALHRYLDDRFETYAGWSNERMSAYDIATGWGGLQGAVVE